MNRYDVDLNKQNQNQLRGEYDTTLIMVDSQVNSIWSGFGYPTIDPITRAPNGKSNAGFTTVLSNPLVLDNNFEYVVSISKISFDIQNYTEPPWTSFNVNFDQIAFQYYDGGQQQVLFKTEPVLCTNSLTTGFFSPYTEEPRNLIFRFLNPSNKVISRITFNITDTAGNGLESTDPTIPTQIQLVIKKVSKTQQY